MKGIQNYHMDSRGWSDIGYNFLVGEDGRIYEVRVKLHPLILNYRSLIPRLVKQFNRDAVNGVKERTVATGTRTLLDSQLWETTVTVSQMKMLLMQLMSLLLG